MSNLVERVKAIFPVIGEGIIRPPQYSLSLDNPKRIVYQQKLNIYIRAKEKFPCPEINQMASKLIEELEKEGYKNSAFIQSIFARSEIEPAVIRYTEKIADTEISTKITSLTNEEPEQIPVINGEIVREIELYIS